MCIGLTVINRPWDCQNTLVITCNYLLFSYLFLSASRQWSSWSPFEECSVTCGQGKKIQRRTCITVDDNSPIDTCIGSRIKESPCVKLICPSGNSQSSHCRVNGVFFFFFFANWWPSLKHLLYFFIKFIYQK